MKRIFFIITILIPGIAALAQSSDSVGIHLSEYQGQETRIIKSLSEEDIQELLNGEGWGLAKVAELNGIPGPRHVLDMGAEINLTEDQKSGLEVLFQVMKEDATALGIKYVDLEKQLNEAFVSRQIDADRLKEMLMQIAHVTYELRFAHLSAHLGTIDILTEEQISMYNELRGYNSGDPCSNIPEGHDAALWKKHNNCL